MKTLREIGQGRHLIWLAVFVLIVVMAVVMSPIAAAGPLVSPIGPP